MIRRIIPAVKLIIIPAGIIFLFVPFVFSKETASILALPKITLPIAREDHAVLELSQYEIVNGEALLRRGRSLDYVNSVLEYSHRLREGSLALGPVEFLRYERDRGRPTGTFAFKNSPARQYNINFLENAGEYEIKQINGDTSMGTHPFCRNSSFLGCVPKRDVSPINDVRERKRFMAEHLMSQKKLMRDLKNTVIIMKKGMAGNITREGNGTSDVVLSQKYQVMKQNLRRLFTDRENIVEVETAEEMFAVVNRILFERKKVGRVMIIDDGSLAGDFSAEAIQAEITEGEPGVNYCLIQASTQEANHGMRQFVDMNDMAMMGLAILSHDPSDRILFEMAYLSFTGEPFVPSDLSSGQWIKWLIRAQPRMGWFDISKPYDQRLLDKLFEESA